MSLLLLAVLCCGCGREEGPRTATIAPAEPLPSRTVTAPLDNRHFVTTSGSPAPATQIAPGSETVIVSAGRIQMRSLLPRAHTALRILNETAASHDLVLRSASVHATAALQPHGEAVLQVRLNDPDYVFFCTIAGHAESARFTTYVAGAPVGGPGAAGSAPR